MNTCLVCGYESDRIIEILDPINMVIVIDYWCPQCHTMETKYFYSDGSTSTNYIKG